MNAGSWGLNMATDEDLYWNPYDRGEDPIEYEEAFCVHETADAILCRSPEFARQLWFPKSQVSFTSEVRHTHDEGKLLVSPWIAVKKGLIEEEE